jgi:hypothetical protein
MCTRLAAAALTIVALLAGGCGGRSLGGRQVTARWSVPPTPSVPAPPDKACYDMPGVRATESPAELSPPVPCAELHTVETISVGAFEAGVAGEGPPTAPNPVRQGAYAACAGSARQVLGDDWRAGRVGLLVAPPTSAQWRTGARWYRCDLVELVDVNADGMAVARRLGSLNGALSGGEALGLGCFAVDVVSATAPKATVPCSRQHNVEFAGVFDAPPGPYPVGPQLYGQSHDGCRKVAAEFVGLPNDATFKERATVFWNGYGQEGWDLGNRGVRCYLVINPRSSVTGSLKGAGERARPLIFA